MPKIDVLSKVDHADEIFSLPQTLLEVLQQVESEDWSAKTISAVISKDAGMTARILKMANSCFYRRNTEILSVNRAVIVLGASMVKCLALSAAIFNPSEEFKAKFKYDIRTLYSHFLSTAIAARQIAEVTHYDKPEEAFTAGLLHDIGMIYILKIAPLEYGEILARHDAGQELIRLERECFDTDHAEIGFLISRRWQLPGRLQNAIGNHHRIATADKLEDYDKLDLIVSLANLINRHVFASIEGWAEEQANRVSRLTTMMAISSDMMNEIVDRNLQETYKAAQHLGIDVGDPLMLLEKANRQILRSYVTIETLFKERQELSKQIIEEEHKLGALNTKNIAVATLSHYINNAATAISGRIQLIAMLVQSGQIADPQDRLGPALEVIDASLSKILAVLAELKSLTSLENVVFYKDSSTMNMDQKINLRLKAMKGTPE